MCIKNIFEFDLNICLRYFGKSVDVPLVLQRQSTLETIPSPLDALGTCPDRSEKEIKSES